MRARPSLFVHLRNRVRRRAGPVAAIAAVATVWLLIAPQGAGAGAAAAFAIHLVPPYSNATPFTMIVCAPLGGAWKLLANNSTGGVWIDVSNSDNTTAGSACNATGGFYGPTFTANATGRFHIVYTWKVHWVATTNAPTTSVVTIKVKLFANLAELTANRWAIGRGHPPWTGGMLGFQGNVTTVVVLSRAGSWTRGGGPAVFTTQLTTRLTAGQHYAFYTGMYVFAGIRGASPSCCPSMKLELGVNGPGGHLQSIVLS